MSYTTKNYTEQGGDVTHFGGKVIFEEGVTFEGLPSPISGGLVVHFTRPDPDEWVYECDTPAEDILAAFAAEADVVAFITEPGPYLNKYKCYLVMAQANDQGDLWLQFRSPLDSNCYAEYRNGEWRVQLPE